MAGRTALSIGNFDGVHIGHAALLRRARALADNGGARGRVVALAFHPHPLTRLRPEQAPPMLGGFERRREALLAAGADEVERLEPTDELLSLTPETFIDRIVARYHPTAIVEGRDFRFGRARAGGVETLAELGRARGFEVSVVEPVDAELDNQCLVTASSSMARWLVQRGRVSDAARVLGRPHELEGIVVQGDRRGRAIGFPTANLRSDGLVPAEAVYAGLAHVPGAREPLAAAIHVGRRATFDDDTQTVEAYVLDWNGTKGAEYGWRARLLFLEHLRDQARFEGVSALVEQIRRDVQRTREIVDRRREREVRVSHDVNAARLQESVR